MCYLYCRSASVINNQVFLIAFTSADSCILCTHSTSPQPPLCANDHRAKPFSRHRPNHLVRRAASGLHTVPPPPTLRSTLQTLPLELHPAPCLHSWILLRALVRPSEVTEALSEEDAMAPVATVENAVEEVGGEEMGSMFPAVSQRIWTSIIPRYCGR